MDRVGIAWPDDVPLSPFLRHGRPDAFGDLVGRVFGDVTVEVLNWEFEFEPETWWRTGAMAGVGSNGVVLARQDAATIAQVKDAYDELVKPYATGDGRVRLPAHALLAHGMR